MERWELAEASADRGRPGRHSRSPIGPECASYPLDISAVHGGLVLYGAATFGLAATGGWVGMAAVFRLAPLLLAVIVAACSALKFARRDAQ